MSLHITRDRQGGLVVLVVDGELDLVTAPDLTGRAMTEIDDGARNVIVDAAALAFCDSSGLAAFVKIATRIGPQGRLAITAPSSMVRRILEVSGLDEAFLLTDSVPEAIAILDAGQA